MVRQADGRTVSAETGEGWRRKTLIRTERGSYYLLTQVYNVPSGRRRLTPQQAAVWLRRNWYKVPRGLEEEEPS
jgi:hypothetical protein